MSHVRTQIRNRVLSTLTGLTTTGSRVYASRVHPMSPDIMPGICLYCGTEKAIDGSLKTTTKAVDLIIDAYVSGSAYDDIADTIQAEVDAALYADFANHRYFNGLVENLSYSMAESKYFGEAKVKHGVLRMIYQATYTTEDGNAETAL